MATNPPTKTLAELPYRSPVSTGRALTPDLDQLDTNDLPGDLWPGAVMSAPGELTPDGWPVSPTHTCGASDNTGTVITIRETYTTATKMITPAWRDNEARQGCPACYHRRVMRYCRQIEVEQGEGQLWSLKLSPEDYKRQAATWRKRASRDGENVRYCPFPQETREYIVIHNQAKEGGDNLPTIPQELYQMVYNLAKTPENKRVSPSNGWGGQWQGARGDGRAKQETKKRKASGETGADATGPCVQLWTNRSLKEIAQRLGAEIERRQRSIKVDVNPFDAYHRLADCELHERHTNRLGVTALLEMFAPLQPENVTPNAHSNTKDSMSLKRDILGEQGQEGKIITPSPSPQAMQNTPLFPKALPISPNYRNYYQGVKHA